MFQSKFGLPLFVLGVLAAGISIGMLFPAGAWHAALQKPGFNPPNWIFGPMWTFLYILIGVAGWRVWARGQDAGLRALWGAQMLLNLCWSPAFFGAQSPGLGLLVIVPMLLAILAFIVRAWRYDRISGLLFLPYALWVAFAALLNVAIYRLN